MIKRSTVSLIGNVKFDEFAREAQAFANQKTNAVHQEDSFANGAPNNNSWV